MISAPVVEELAKGLALVVAFLASRWASRRFGAVRVRRGHRRDRLRGRRRHRLRLHRGPLLLLPRGARRRASPRRSTCSSTAATSSARRCSATRSGPRPSAPGSAPPPGRAPGGARSAGRCSGWSRRCSCTRSTTASSRSCSRSSTGSRPPTTTSRSASRSSSPIAWTRPRESIVDALDWISLAYVVAFFVLIALGLRHQRRVIREQLVDEVESGLITAEQAATAGSFRRPRAHASSPRYGPATSRARTQTSILCRELAELAFCKGRLAGLDDPQATGRAPPRVRPRRARGPGSRPRELALDVALLRHRAGAGAAAVVALGEEVLAQRRVAVGARRVDRGARRVAADLDQAEDLADVALLEQPALVAPSSPRRRPGSRPGARAGRR